MEGTRVFAAAGALAALAGWAIRPRPLGYGMVGFGVAGLSVAAMAAFDGRRRRDAAEAFAQDEVQGNDVETNGTAGPVDRGAYNREAYDRSYGDAARTRARRYPDRAPATSEPLFARPARLFGRRALRPSGGS